jgi:Ni/Co efflux regulator RcnB
MKSRAIVSTVVAASLGIASVSSFAQSWDGRGQHRDQRASQDARTQRHDGERSAERQRYVQPSQPAAAVRFSNRGYVQPGYGYDAPRRDWRRGDRLPDNWRHRMHPVGNWGAYNLYAPPSGYGWVQSDAGDYLLVALATGLIANLLMSR